jgi:hypothetical protein
MNNQTVADHRTVQVQAVNMKVRQTEDYANLKIKVNTLLWEELPAKTTLEDAERMACEIFALILGDDLFEPRK